MEEKTADTVVDGPKSHAPRPHLEPGAAIDRYVVLEVLGEGGMGVIYRARDPSLDRQVAVKCVRPSRHSASLPRARERLMREAHALAQLSHPNVVAIYDVGVSGDDVFIAMELVEGESLKEWLDNRPAIDAIRDAFLAAAGGLAAAHKVGLVHRDFKPDNVVVGADGRVRVIDFGLARPAGGSSDDADESSDDQTPVPEIAFRSPRYEWAAHGLTRIGAVVGTPQYMAPEQYRGEVDQLTDQFSFGVSLYEAIYRKRPFVGLTRDELMDAMKRGPDEPDGVKVPVQLRKVMRRAMAFDRSARYPTMNALIADLRPGTRKARAWIAASITAVAIAGLAGFMALRGSEPQEPCAGGEARLIGVWDAQVRDAMDRAFRHTGLGVSTEIYQRVSEILDTYTKSAIDTQRESCLATTVRKEQSAELLDLRAACLDRRWSALGALTRELSAVRKPEAVVGAVEAVRALPAIDACNDAKSLRQAYPPPTPGAQAQTVAAAQALVDEARALYATGDIARGADAARRASVLASGAGYPPALADALFALGMCERTATSVEHETATWRGAIAAGSEARDDRLVANAWTQLMSLTADGKPDEALRMETAVDAAVLRAGNDPGLRSRLLTVKGAAYSGLGKHEEGVAAFQEGLDLAAKKGATDDNLETLAAAHLNLGFELQQIGKLTAAQKEIEDATALIVRARGPNHPQIAWAKLHLGDTLLNADHYDDAERLVLAAEAIWKKAYGPDYLPLADAEADLGVIASYRGDHATARKRLTHAVALSEKALGPDDASNGNLYSSFALVLRRAGDYRGAQEQLQRTLAIFTKRNGLDSLEVAGAYADMADLAVAHKKFAEARPLYEKALHRAESMQGDDIAVGDMLVGMAACDVAMRQFARAAAEASRAADLFGKPNGLPFRLARARFQLARARWELGTDRRSDVALAHQALDGYKAVGAYWPDERAEIEAWLASHR